MIYKGFPRVDRRVAFENKSPLSLYKDIIHIQDSLNPSRLSLEVLDNKPIYRYGGSIVDAATGIKINGYSASHLDSLINAEYKCDFDKKIINDYDQWIPLKSYSRYFPIHKYYLKDGKGTVVYMSEKTPEKIQITSRKTRFWASVGAIPHLYYFKSLRLNRTLWSNVIMVLASLGIIMSLSGLVAGFIMYRKKKKRKNILDFSPYKNKWYKWHHIVGLLFGLFMFTFVFSGLLSTMSIPQWILPLKREVNYSKLWKESPKDFSTFKLSLNTLLSDKRFKDVKTIEWSQIDGVPYYLAYKQYRKPILIKADDSLNVSIKEFNYDEVKEIASRKFKGLSYDISKIIEYDGYYNNPQNDIVKIRFNDADKTWVYIDLANPDFMPSLNKSSRLRRWLYSGIHTLNIPGISSYPWLRKTLLIILCGMGIIISFSGLIMGIKYFKRISKRYGRRIRRYFSK